jgi:chromosome transmission fidelity protein 18
VVARHCGYRSIEINASDDRSPDVIKELIHRATHNSTLGSDKRPNCIVIDEIDGMDGGGSGISGSSSSSSSKSSLDVLVEILNAPVSSSAASTSSSSSSSSKKAASSSVFGLTRPLICICNDQYAPVLKELKKSAEIFHFVLPQDLRLVHRLQDICKQENIPSPSQKILSELVTATGHDIRSSINNLQFACLNYQRVKSSETSSASSAGIFSYCCFHWFFFFVRSFVLSFFLSFFLF